MSDFLTVTQAADEAGVTRQHILEEIKLGRIAATKISDKATGSYVINRKSFETWNKQRRARQAERA